MFPVLFFLFVIYLFSEGRIVGLTWFEHFHFILTGVFIYSFIFIFFNQTASRSNLSCGKWGNHQGSRWVWKPGFSGKVGEKKNLSSGKVRESFFFFLLLLLLFRKMGTLNHALTLLFLVLFCLSPQRVIVTWSLFRGERCKSCIRRVRTARRKCLECKDERKCLLRGAILNQ